MPFLDWVNKAQAVRVAGAVPYHLLNFESAHGDAAAENLLALKALLPFYRGRFSFSAPARSTWSRVSSTGCAMSSGSRSGCPLAPAISIPTSWPS
jgi:hypothetical protein